MPNFLQPKMFRDLEEGEVIFCGDIRSFLCKTDEFPDHIDHTWFTYVDKVYTKDGCCRWKHAKKGIIKLPGYFEGIVCGKIPDIFYI